jgi:hypothetical protein
MANLTDTLGYSDTVIINLENDYIFSCYIRNDSTLILKKVEIIEDTSKTILIKYKFYKDMGSGLTITNKFGVSVFYKAELFNHETQKYLPTNTYPVRPRRFSSDYWPAYITKMRLTEFKLVDEKIGQKKGRKKKKKK